MPTWVIVKANFIGFHQWKDAPEEVSFLRDYHRHIFYVELHLQVKDLNRELEFFLVKRKLQSELDKYYSNEHFEESCEMIATRIKTYFEEFYKTKCRCSVFEDNENGAMVE